MHTTFPIFRTIDFENIFKNRMPEAKSLNILMVLKHSAKFTTFMLRCQMWKTNLGRGGDRAASQHSLLQVSS